MCGAPVAGAMLSRQQTATKGMLPCGILLLVVWCFCLVACLLFVGRSEQCLFTMNALWSHCYRYMTAYRHFRCGHRQFRRRWLNTPLKSSYLIKTPDYV